MVNPHSCPTHRCICSFSFRWLYGFLCTGFLPTRVPFPALAVMLLGVGVKNETLVLLYLLMDYISEVDRGVLREALTISRAHSVSCHFSQQSSG